MTPPAAGDSRTADKHRSHHHHHSSHHHKSHHHQSKSHHHKSHRHEKKEHRQSDRRTKSPARHTSPSGSKKERKNHHYHHHHQAYHHQHVSGNANVHGTGNHPSSSLGPGRVETVLAIILAILIISSIALFCVGIWLLVARTGWPSGLDNTGSLPWTRFISYATACIIVAILFIPIVILAAWAAVAKRGSRARKLRLAVVFLASFTALLLLLMTATALLFATGPPFINSITERSWVFSATDFSNSARVCNIQRQYNCDGWEDNSCLNCKPSVNGEYSTPGGNCSDWQKNICPPCYEYSTNGNGVSTFSNSPPNQKPKKGPRQRQSARSKANKAKNRSRQGLYLKVAKIGKRHLNLLRQQGQQQVALGCRRYIEWRNREFFIPMCVYTIFLILVLILLSWKTCIDSSSR